MAMIRKRGNRFELRVKHNLLPKRTFYSTFDSETEARAYGTKLEALLAQGLLPQDLVVPRNLSNSPTLARLIRDYQMAVPVSALDVEILDLLYTKIGAVRIDQALRYQWAEQWIRGLKFDSQLAPGTIRKRVGAVARMIDWYLKRETHDGETPLANPLRLLPKNYSAYNAHERHTLTGQANAKPLVDTSRDRRLGDNEEARILAALRGEKRGGGERPLLLPEGPALADLFLLLVNTGLRLREAYTLRHRDVRFDAHLLHVRRSKTGAARDVPLLPDVQAMLKARCETNANSDPKTSIFPWWRHDANQNELRRITSMLSRAMGRAFEYANCQDLTTHDLRHEATCRWMLKLDSRGHWLFRMEEVMRITGHKDPRTFMRYVSLRGSDLADRLWATPPKRSD